MATSFPSNTDIAANREDYNLRQIKKGLIEGCSYCGNEVAPDKCEDCPYVQYCNEECMIAHEPVHKPACKHIDCARRNVYCQAVWSQLAHVRAMLTTRTRIAAENAVQRLKDIPDYYTFLETDTDVKTELAALLLRLGREKECSDVCEKALAKEIQGSLEAARSESEPESVHDSNDNCPNPVLIPLTLLKIRLLIDLKALQRVQSEAGPHVPQEILDMISRHVPKTDIIAKDSAVIQRQNHSSEIANLKIQILDSYHVIERANGAFWRTLIRADDSVDRPLDQWSCSTSKQNKASALVETVYDSWAETPGAIDAIYTIYNSPEERSAREARKEARKEAKAPRKRALEVEVEDEDMERGRGQRFKRHCMAQANSSFLNGLLALSQQSVDRYRQLDGC